MVDILELGAPVAEATDGKVRLRTELRFQHDKLPPGSVTVWLRSPISFTSCWVFQLMPLPPLPSLSSSGPIEVNFL